MLTSTVKSCSFSPCYGGMVQSTMWAIVEDDITNAMLRTSAMGNGQLKASEVVMAKYDGIISTIWKISVSKAPKSLD